jgi:hypothetical protein
MNILKHVYLKAYMTSKFGSKFGALQRAQKLPWHVYHMQRTTSKYNTQNTTIDCTGEPQQECCVPHSKSRLIQNANIA